jgi:glycosyltransferase involved in cell wall biosynthesis
MAMVSVSPSASDDQSRERARLRADPPKSVAVVIPAFNAAQHLSEQLAAVRAQDSPFLREVIVVNNASTDSTRQVAERWQADWSKLVVIDEPRSGGNVARNTGVRASQSEIVLLCDSDDVVGEGWISALRIALADHDLARGRYELDVLNDAQVRAARGPVEATLQPDDQRPLQGLGGNCAFWRAVWLEMGGLYEHHYGSDDEEFFWRAQLAGYDAAFVDDAVVHYRLRPSLTGLYRQQKAWASNRAQLYREFGHHGFIRRRSANEAAKAWAWLLLHAGDAFSADVERRGRWIRVAAGNAGRLSGSVRHRVFYP